METYGSKDDDSKETGHHAEKSAEFTPPSPERQLRVPIVLFDRHREHLDATENQTQERKIEGHKDGTEGQSNESDDDEGKEKKEKGTGAAQAIPQVPHAFRPIIPRPAEIHPNPDQNNKPDKPTEQAEQPQQEQQPEVTATQERPKEQETIPNPPEEVENQTAAPDHAAESEPNDVGNTNTKPNAAPESEDPYAGMYGPEPGQRASQPSAPPPSPQAGTGGNQPPTPPTVPPTQSLGSSYPQQPNYNVWNAHNPYTTPQHANYYASGPAFSPGINPNIAPSIPTTEHVPVYDKRSGVGAVAALLGLEYLARKRADKRQNKLIKENQKKQQELAEAQQRFEQQQRSFRTEQQGQTTDMRRMQQVQERFNTQPAQQQPSAFAERPQVPTVPRMNGMPPIHERQVSAADGWSVMPNTVQPKSPREHVVQDAWRAYRVDEHNREIVDSAARGQAFTEEQREIQRDQVAAVPQPQAAHATSTPHAEQQAYDARPNYIPRNQYVGGFGTGSAGPSTGQAGVNEPMLPSGMTAPYLPVGAPTHADPQHQLPSVAPKQKATSGAPGVWFWVMLALIIAAFFAAALI